MKEVANVVVAPGELDAPALALEAPGLRKLRLQADDVEGLLPDGIGKRGLIAHVLQPRLQVQPRELITPRGRPASLQQVRGQEQDGRLEGS